MDKFFDFIQKSTTPYHCVENSIDLLREAGFEEVFPDSGMQVEKGKKYYFQRNGSYLFAFTVGEDYEPGNGFRMAAAHDDSPCFRVKSHAEKILEDYAFLNTEGYGGANFTNWLDRPLSIAGRISVESEHIFRPHTFHFDLKEPAVIIPGLAVHFTKTDNEYQTRNSVRLPLYSVDKRGNFPDNGLRRLISEKLDIDPEQILDYELYVYNPAPCEKIGIHKEMTASPRLDDLTGVYGVLQGLMRAEQSRSVNAAVIFDNEEVGNISKNGAFSNATEMLWKMVYKALGYEERVYYEEAMKSYLISVDTAQAFHPLFPEVYDRNSRCRLNRGVCIKQTASQAYATDSVMSGIIQQICRSRGIPFQKYANHADIKGGGTLGSIVSCILAGRTADIGVPVLSMHSPIETMGNEDEESLIRFLEAFFSIA